MKEINQKAAGITTYGKQFGLTIGVVKNNADPMQHGRLQVYVPAYDAIDYKAEDLPWCNYVSPFAGVTANFKVGPEQESLPGISAYGFWAIPKNSAQVLIGCIDGNPETRFWLGCIYQPEFNRTMPTGINGVSSEIDDSGVYGQHDFSHMRTRLKEAGLDVGDKHFNTRGGYERSISHPSNKNRNKPTDNGYAPKPLEPEKADSQTVTLTTPGRHSLIMSDVNEHGRVRLKTTNGQQVIFDDTNERIYISTARGKNWIELDESSGKIYIYSDAKINIRSKNDLNLYSDENINIVAKKRLNIRSEERAVKIQAHRNIELLSTNANIKVSASRDLHLKTFSGPIAPAISETIKCAVRPAVPTGLLRDWAEEAGSSTSKLFIDTVDGSDYNVSGGYLKVTTATSVDIKSGSHIVIDAATNFDMKAGQVLTEDAGSVINHRAGSSLNDQAPSINHNGAIQGITYAAQLFIGPRVNGTGNPGPAGSASSAQTAGPAAKVTFEDVVSKMIRPDHESWERDEDEPQCPTPRNSKYQG